ncbi:AidA/PixA family protein [Bradyrhizobium pachyrhizi]|uniref:AidA/PixA family protein n=1 Tax=Bradyrhizobium pachyrhizi TaxID=280333 RepID=UPI00067A95FC|nr:AidA/PixA family protein [Bradyrhizobium pachyrhizi]
MAQKRSSTKRQRSESHVAVLIIVDAETLLSRYPNISLSPDAPVRIDSEHIYVLATRDGGPLGTNDGHLDLAVTPGVHLRIRGNALALRGEHIVAFYGIAQEHAGVLSPFEFVLRQALTVATPNFENLLQPSNQSIDDHFWQSQVLADGVAPCDLNFMVLNKACSALGYFRWRLQINVAGLREVP